MKKMVGSTLKLSAKVFFPLDKYEKIFCWRDQKIPFAYSCSFTFHTSYEIGMIGHRGGGRCQNAQKQFNIKTY